MNIRIDPYELEKIKERAAREGLRYQTLRKKCITQIHYRAAG